MVRLQNCVIYFEKKKKKKKKKKTTLFENNNVKRGTSNVDYIARYAQWLMVTGCCNNIYSCYFFSFEVKKFIGTYKTLSPEKICMYKFNKSQSLREY